MKNLAASFLLFFILIFSIVLSMNYLENKSDYYSQKADYLEQIISQELWDKAYDTSLEFLEEWDKDSKTVSAFINHMHVEGINNEVLKLTQYIKYEEKVESLALVHEIKFLIQGLTNMEKVTIANVF